VEQLDRTPKYCPPEPRSSLPQTCPCPRVASVAAVGSASVASNALVASVGVEFAHRSQAGPRLAPVPISVIDDLRVKVRAIEQHPAIIDAASYGSSLESWTLGDSVLDAALGCESGRAGLDCAGVHEIKPLLLDGASAAASWALSIGFSLRLAMRRGGAPRPIVWCWPKALANELGHLHGPGLAQLGLDPSRILFVETARATDALWGMDEALRSNAACLVLGVLNEVDLIEGRRLSLASQAHATPCLLMTHGGRAASAATATRWRVGLLPSSPHPLVPRLPGAFRVSVTIERCRANPALPQSVPFALEWCDEAHRFGLSAAMANREIQWRDSPCRQIPPFARNAS
jgi:protein ImuA